MADKNALDWIAFVLVMVGAINWGLYAFDYNLVNMILGAVPVLEQVVYVLVALSALYMIYTETKK